MTLAPDAPDASQTSEASSARTDAVRALEAEFGELVTQFRQQIQAVAQRVSPGMLPGAYKMLTTIERRGPLTLSSLSECLVADKGLASRTVRDLEKLGLIERTPDPNDGRSSLLSLTLHGAERLAAARGPAESRLQVVLQDWPLGDIQQLTSLLHSLSTGEAPAR